MLHDVPMHFKDEESGASKLSVGAAQITDVPAGPGYRRMEAVFKAVHRPDKGDNF